MRRVVVAVAVLTALGGTVSSAQPREELVERTVAIVGGRAVTLADTTTAMALGLIDEAVDVDAAIAQLVERALVLREVERYAPPEPPAHAIDDKLAEMRGRLSEALVATALRAGGFTEARLHAWVRDDLRIAAYLEQRFAVTADLTVEQAAPELRERLSAERRASLIADWVADLRRRTPVVELWKR
jgi:hypothetical protein